LKRTLTARVIHALTALALVLATAPAARAATGGQRGVGAPTAAQAQRLGLALTQAAEQNDTLRMRWLLDLGADPNFNQTGVFRYPVVLVAASHGNAAAVRLLLTRGARANATDVRGTPVLISAVALAFGNRDEAGVNECVRLLLELGHANPNAADTARIGDDRGALHQAAANGSAALTRLLLRFGAHPDQTDRFGETPLHFAALRGRVEAARVLLEAGANPDARARHTGMTPLMTAAESGRHEMVRFLLEHRADRRLRNVFGQTSIDLALAASQDAERAARLGQVREPASRAPQLRQRFQATIEALRARRSL
jgi:ankyrin repeat protein